MAAQAYVASWGLKFGGRCYNILSLDREPELEFGAGARAYVSHAFDLRSVEGLTVKMAGSYDLKVGSQIDSNVSEDP